jgi:mannose-6-phosphate isomerase-like protein (cupin superfamily)
VSHCTTMATPQSPSTTPDPLLPPGVQTLVTWSMRRLTHLGAAAAPLVAALRTVGTTLPARPPRRVTPVPALRHLPMALAGVDPTDPLATALRDTVGLAAWDTYYAPSDPWAAPFVDGFANGSLIGPDGPWVSDTVQLATALYAPGMVYPPHAHAAVEAYLVVAGHATYSVARVAGSVAPGDAVFHPSDALHAYQISSDGPLWLAWVRAGVLSGPLWVPLPDGGRHHPATVA